MKVAILGSAPSSLHLAPFADKSWAIWGCSPGVYPMCSRVDAWFELHRWEPPVIGNPAKQKTWFSPEYVAWMALRACPVWMQEPVSEIPASKALPVAALTAKFGTYYFTSTIAWMLAMAIEAIMAKRAWHAQTEIEGPDAIGLWGVDMTATDEWMAQRPAAQHFLLLAGDLGIKVVVPHESDLLVPPPLYGICESEPWHIKMTARMAELEGRLEDARNRQIQARHDISFLEGGIQDMRYHLLTWGETRVGLGTSQNMRAMEAMPQGMEVEADDPTRFDPPPINKLILKGGLKDRG